MAEDKTGKFCKHCNRRVPASRRGTNHLLHLFLTIFTGGIWLLGWIWASIKIGGWRCTVCGSKV